MNELQRRITLYSHYQDLLPKLFDGDNHQPHIAFARVLHTIEFLEAIQEWMKEQEMLGIHLIVRKLN